MIHIKIELTNTSQPIERDVDNTYVKGPFYCAYGGGKVEKFPVEHIFRVTENYS